MNERRDEAQRAEHQNADVRIATALETIAGSMQRIEGQLVALNALEAIYRMMR